MASFYDSFQRADNASAIGTSDSGVNWTTLAGTFGILAGQVYNPSGALSHATVDLGMSDCVVRWTIPIEHAATAMLIRCTDVNNLFYLRQNGGVYDLSKIVAGVFTHLTSGTQLAASGDFVTVRCNGSSIGWYVNGVFDTSFSDAFNQTETHFGIRCADTSTRYGSMAAQALAAGGAIWHVTTSGTTLGDGSQARPWDFRTAMTYTPGIVQPLDQILIHQGNYQTSGDPANIVLIGDGSTNYIDVRRAPNENWPRIYTGIWCQQSAGSAGGVRFWGLQIVQNNPQRINNYRGDNPTYGWGGMLLEAPNTEFHYCIVANCAGIAGGWFYGEQALNAKVHMCLTYYNGFRYLFNGLPAGQGFYRQADDAGTGKFQYIDTCITCLNYQTGMQIYGSGAANLNHARTDKSLWFYGGYLGSTYSAGQAIHEILIGSLSTFVLTNQCYFDRQWCWPFPTTALDSGVSLGYNGQDNTFVSWTNSVSLGRMVVQYFRNLEFYGNTVVQPQFNHFADEIFYTSVIGHLPAQQGLGVDHNLYYQTNDGDNANHPPFIYNDSISNHSYGSVAAWNAATGYDANSTLSPYGTQPSISAVYPNTVEPTALFPTPRAFAYVFDFQSTGTATLDLSACFNAGDFYAIYDWGQYELDNPVPVAAGTVPGNRQITLTLKQQYLPTLIADPNGSRSQNAGLPGIAPGQPAAYILAQTTQQEQTTVGTVGFSPPAAPIHGHFPIHRRFAWKKDYRNKS